MQGIYQRQITLVFLPIHLDDQKVHSVFLYLAPVTGKQVLLTIIFYLSNKVHYD